MLHIQWPNVARYWCLSLFYLMPFSLFLNRCIFFYTVLFFRWNPAQCQTIDNGRSANGGKRANGMVLVVNDDSGMERSCRVGQCHDQNKQQPSTCRNSLGLPDAKTSYANSIRSIMMMPGDETRHWNMPQRPEMPIQLVWVGVYENACIVNRTEHKPFPLRSKSQICHHLRLWMLEIMLKLYYRSFFVVVCMCFLFSSSEKWAERQCLSRHMCLAGFVFTCAVYFVFVYPLSFANDSPQNWKMILK